MLHKVRKSHTIKNKQLDVKKALPKNEMDRMNNRGGSRDMNNRSFGPRNERNSSGPSWSNNSRNNNDGWMNNGPYNNSSGFNNGSNSNWNHNSQPAPWNNNQGSQGEGKDNHFFYNHFPYSVFWSAFELNLFLSLNRTNVV